MNYKGKRFNSWLLKLVSLFTAIFLWIVIVNVNDPKITKVISNVPVTITNQEKIKESGKVFEVLDNSNTVNITVYGHRSVVEKLNSNSFQPTANMEELTFMNTIRIEANPKVLGLEVNNIIVNPANLKISLEEEESKKFVINIDLAGTKPDENFEVSSTTSTKDSLIISGPKSIIDKLDKVLVVADVTGMKENGMIHSPFKVFDKNGDEIDSSTYDSLVFHNVGKDRTIGIEVNLLKVKKVPLDFRTYNRPAEGYEVIGYKSTPELISIVGEDEVLNETEAIYVEMTNDISYAKKDVSTTVDIQSFLPPGIKLASGENEKVIVDTQIALLNSWNIEVPVVSIKTENLGKDVQVTYPKEERLLIPINRTEGNDRILQVKDVEASVNLSNLGEGNYDLPVKVKLPQGFLLESDEITVSVTISKKE